MVRVLNVTFEDEEYDKLLEAKGKTPWRKFIINLISN